MTDAELQAIVGTALRGHLKKAGFHTGTRTDDSSAFMFCVNLDLAGTITVERTLDGDWTISQELDAVLSDRTADAHASLMGAVQARLSSMEGEGGH